jgi:hypothetical protein
MMGHEILTAVVSCEISLNTVTTPDHKLITSDDVLWYLSSA